MADLANTQHGTVMGVFFRFSLFAIYGSMKFPDVIASWTNEFHLASASQNP